MIQSRNQHLIQSPFPTPYTYVSPKEPPVDFGEPPFVKMFECECSHEHILAPLNSAPIVGTGTTDYSHYLSIQPGMCCQSHISWQCVHPWHWQLWTSVNGSVARRKSITIAARSHLRVANYSLGYSEHLCWIPRGSLHSILPTLDSHLRRVPLTTLLRMNYSCVTC